MTSGCALDLSGRAGDEGTDAETVAPDDGAVAVPLEAGSARPDGGAHPAKDAGPIRDATVDGTSPEASAPDASPPDGSGPNPCTNAVGPCAVVPAGWTLVARAPAQSSPCPAGFDGTSPSDVVEGPSVAGGCSCGACSVTATPTCNAGTIAVSYDTNTSPAAGTCSTVANPSPLGNTPAGSCGTDIYQGDYSTYDVRYAAPAPSGGTCSAPGVQNSAAISYAARGRLLALERRTTRRRPPAAGEPASPRSAAPTRRASRLPARSPARPARSPWPIGWAPAHRSRAPPAAAR